MVNRSGPFPSRKGWGRYEQLTGKCDQCNSTEHTVTVCPVFLAQFGEPSAENERRRDEHLQGETQADPTQGETTIQVKTEDDSRPRADVPPVDASMGEQGNPAELEVSPSEGARSDRISVSRAWEMRLHAGLPTVILRPPDRRHPDFPVRGTRWASIQASLKLDLDDPWWHQC